MFDASRREQTNINIIVSPERPALSLSLAHSYLNYLGTENTGSLWVDEIALRYREDVKLPIAVRFLLDQTIAAEVATDQCFYGIGENSHYTFNPSGWTAAVMPIINDYFNRQRIDSPHKIVTTHPHVIHQIAKFSGDVKLVLVYPESSAALHRVGNWINYLFGEDVVSKVLFILCRQQYQGANFNGIKNSFGDSKNLKHQIISSSRDDIFNLPANGAWISEDRVLQELRHFIHE